MPRHSLSSYGRRAFAVAGLTAWNSLSDDLRDPSHSTDSFRRLLKTRLFSEYWYIQRIRGIAFCELYKFTTYLLTNLKVAPDVSLSMTGGRPQCVTSPRGVPCQLCEASYLHRRAGLQTNERRSAQIYQTNVSLIRSRSCRSLTAIIMLIFCTKRLTIIRRVSQQPWMPMDSV